MCFSTHILSPTLFFPAPHPFQNNSHGSFQHMDLVSGPECAAWGEGEAGETARMAEWDLSGSYGKSGGSQRAALCVFSDAICPNRLHHTGRHFRNRLLRLHLLFWITKHNIFKALDTFAVFLRSPNHKNLILGSGPLASTPIAVGIDRRSIPTAGDNHSVSASTDPNSYLGLLTASTAQMTTGPQISLYCSKAPSGHLVGNVSQGPNLHFVSSTGCIHSPDINLDRNGGLYWQKNGSYAQRN